MSDNHKFQIAAVHWHGVESAILALKQGFICVSGDFLQENVVQSEVSIGMLAQHINLVVSIDSCVHDSPIAKNGTSRFSGTPSRKTGNSHVLHKQLIRELRKTDLSEFFIQYLEHIDVSLV